MRGPGGRIMKYLKNIKSFDDLKSKYRNLALKNHPDRGGDIEIMKIINNEYDLLFPIWKRKVEYSSGVEIHETAAQTRSEFYTEYGWKGEKYDLDIAEIAKRIRAYVKEVWSECRFSISISRFSGGCSLSAALTEGPWPKSDKENINRVINDVNREIESYRFYDCDGMIDYFNVSFWFHGTEIGKWDKDYKVVDRKPKVRKVQVKS